MTISLLPVTRPTSAAARDVLPVRCDLCGSPVADIAAHLIGCVERELELFAAGRRAS